MIEYLLFPVGFIALIKGADLLVDGASAVARKLNVSDLVIGLTIVSFGTSAPELMVNVMASLKNSPDLAYGNVVGSNICNVLLILGVASLIAPLTVQKMTVYREIPFGLLAAIILLALVNDKLIDHAASSAISRIDGIVLLGFFSIFLYYIYTISKAGSADEGETKPMSLGKSFVFVVVGLAGLLVGGDLIVKGAVSLAKLFGMSEKTIGLSIVAIGTSLPELAASAMAAYKKKNDIAIGNVVGSNIFNIFLILGVSASIKPLPVTDESFLNQGFLLGSSLILFLALIVGREHRLKRWHGAVFLCAYTFYLSYLVLTG